MTFADTVFHNCYLVSDIFCKVDKRYCDIHNGDLLAKKGLISLLQCKTDNGDLLVFTYHAMDWAAANGHLDVVQWLHTNRQEGCTTDAMDWAAMNGHLGVVQWLRENRTEGCTSYAMDYADENGHLEIVQWLHKNCTENCITYAIGYAHLEHVQWLQEFSFKK